MEPTVDIFLMKSILAKSIDVKDTLDYALFGLKEPKLIEQFLLLGPIFSGFRTQRYFVGVTTSGIVFVEVNGKYEEKKHRFYKYYELEAIRTRSALKGLELTLELRDKQSITVVFPRVVLGLNSQEDDTNASIRVIEEKIKASKEYFRNNQRNQRNQRRKKKEKNNKERDPRIKTSSRQSASSVHNNKRYNKKRKSV